jgi:hypothetical protein
MTPELRQLIGRRARDLQVQLNHAGIDPVGVADEARQLFEEAADGVRFRWLTLELSGYVDHVAARPLHDVLGVPSGDRLAAHVAAYRSQRGIIATPGRPGGEFRHFFVESLGDLIAARERVAGSSAETLLLDFGPHPRVPAYPRSAEFSRDVFDRVVLGFLAALHLQLGTLV